MSIAPEIAAESEPERHNHAERDHCQDDAVLGHRLTLLDLQACAEVMDQIRERHDGFTPFRDLERALARRETLELSGGVESTRNSGELRDTPLRPFSLGAPLRRMSVNLGSIHRLARAERVSLGRVIRAESSLR